MPAYPYRESESVPWDGKMKPPRGKDCAWLVAHAFGNRSRTRKICVDRLVVLEKETTISTAKPTADGSCEVSSKTIIIRIHLGTSCDPGTFQEVVGGVADEEFDVKEAEINRREEEEKKKKGSGKKS